MRLFRRRRREPTAREVVLGRIREALDGGGTGSDGEPAAPPARATPPPRAYRTHGEHATGSAAVIEMLVDRLVDYRALVRRVEATDDLPVALTHAVGAAGLRTIVVPPWLPTAQVVAAGAAGATVLVDGPGGNLDAARLDRIDAVVTAARVAIAETGTIVLDGQGDQGRRAITLVPDHHICIVRTDQVVQTVPEAVDLLLRAPRRPLTWISGPSATSDIELDRVEGVHGPRTLEVLLVGPAAGASSLAAAPEVAGAIPPSPVP